MLDIIIPTVGRDTLERTIGSITTNNGFNTKTDRIYVISDGVLIKNLEKHKEYLTYKNLGPINDYGASQINLGIMSSSNPYVMFMDDDDVYTENALEIVKNTIYQMPEQYYIFKMAYGSKMSNSVLWKKKEIKYQNVSTQMFCVHREGLGNIPPWNGRFGNDYDFISHYGQLNPNKKCIWVDEIIAIYRPLI